MWDVIREPGPRGHDAAADDPVPRGGRRAGRHDRGRSTTARSSPGAPPTSSSRRSAASGSRSSSTSRDDIDRARELLARDGGGEPTLDEHTRKLTVPGARRRRRRWSRSCATSTRPGSRSTTSACAGRPSTTCSSRLTGHAAEADADGGRGMSDRKPASAPRRSARRRAPPGRAPTACVVTWRNLKRIPRIPELRSSRSSSRSCSCCCSPSSSAARSRCPGTAANAYREYLMPGIFAQTIVVRRGDHRDRHGRRHATRASSTGSARCRWPARRS